MEEVTRKKPTEAEMQEAINPDLSTDYVELPSLGERVQIKILNSRKEQRFLQILQTASKDITEKMQGKLEGKSFANFLSIVVDMPVESVGAAAKIILDNSNKTIDDALSEDVLSLVEMADLIAAQINKQRYLDFLPRIVSLFRLGKAH